jgi:hypothetical protein
MDTVKNLVAGASDAIASAAQSAKESLTGVQEKVGPPLNAVSCKPAHSPCSAIAAQQPACLDDIHASALGVLIYMHWPASLLVAVLQRTQWQ